MLVDFDINFETRNCNICSRLKNKTSLFFSVYPHLRPASSEKETLSNRKQAITRTEAIPRRTASPLFTIA